MTIKLFYAHILRAVSQPNLAERSSRNQRLISPSLSLLLGWHGPSKWCRDLWCAKIESKECHLRWRKGNSAGGKGLDWNVGVCDRDARVRRREWVEGGGGETETFLKAGTAAVTESLEVLTCIWAACQPEQTRVPLPSTAVQLESFAASHSRAMISTHAETNYSRYSTNAAWEYIAFSPPAKRLKRPVNPLPAYLFSSEFDQDLWHALLSSHFVWLVYLCTSILLKNVWQISRFRSCYLLMVVSLCNISISTSNMNHAHPVFISVKQICFFNHPKSPFFFKNKWMS